MPRVLFLVSSATSMTLADGTPHVTGYFADEALKPWDRFVEAGVEVVIATPDGQAPRPDPYGLQPRFHYPDDDEDFMASVVRSFMHDPDDIRVTLSHLTEQDLVAARRVYFALTGAGAEPAAARSMVETAARQSWSSGRNYIDILREDDAVTAHVPAATLRQLADDVQRDATAAADEMAVRLDALPGIREPLDLRTLTDDEVLAFDAVFVPGGHGPMVDMAENPDVGRVLRLLHDSDATVAALCHGPAALLSAGERPDGQWLFDGYKLTSFTDEEEDQTEAGKLGMEWYLETALKNAGGVFDDAPGPWVSHVVVDRNLITAQNPASSEAAADAVLKRLEVL